MVTPVKAFSAASRSTPLAAATIERRDIQPRDVQFDVLFCGVCHSDISTARSIWPDVMYPCVPGHEIVGRVTKVGSDVKGFKPGDFAAAGCMVDSCRTCVSCKLGLEQYCDTAPPNGMILTYNGPDKYFPGKPTYGGYSSQIVVDEHFCLHVDGKQNLAAVAPLLCAGITLYSPLKHWGAGQGKKVGIVGLGGLGHMGVKLSHALGAHTVLFTTSPGKVEDGKRLGADEVVVSRNADEMAKQANRLDLIVDTVAVPHDLDPFIAALNRDSALVLVGAPGTPHPSPGVFPLLMRRRHIAGSGIGGIKETQEMLDFCAAHNIVSDIEITPIQKINEAHDRVLKSDVRYRFVIDMASLNA
jgi:uncharacterized zinc-type alcohol dehydrogenase-like protein